MVNYDYGKDSAGDSLSAHWQGLAAYLKYQATPVVAFTPRFEFYDDHDGFTTGVEQHLKEFTGTLELKAADNLMWRIELRHDWSDKEPFADHEGNLKGSQTSIGFGLLYSFGHKLQ
jgi:hypothetical protein